MKRIILLMLILSCLILSACTDDKSIGVIGGADGPTAIYVSGENGESTEKKPVRMIRVDGALYYDSGKVSDIPRCGNMDGNLTKSADAYEIPQKDGECNFDCEKGYQHGTQMTKDIPIDGEWVTFKKIDDPEKDLLQYKYCYSLKGTMPNAAKESEFIVLANDKDLNFAQVTKSLYSSNIKDFLNIYIIPILPEDKWGITLTATDVTATGLTLRFKQFGGAPTGELQTGSAYTLERNHDGIWDAVKTKTDEPLIWNSLAFMIAKNDITTLETNWEYGYGELPAGTYRIGKKVDDFRETGDYDSETYYAEFVIEE